MKIRVSLLFYFSAVLYVALGKADFLFSYLTAVVLHELSHAAAAKRCGFVMNELRLMPYGAAIVGDVSDATPGEEIKIALVGPAVSVLIALITAAAWWLFPVSYPYTQAFAEINICLAAVNLLPVFPLDGGRVLLGVLSRRLPRKKAYSIMRVVGIVVAVLLSAAFVVSCFFGANATLATMSVFLLASTLFPTDNVRYVSLFELAAQQSRLERGLEITTVAISVNAPASRLKGFMRKGALVRFEVYDNGKPVYIIRAERLQRVPNSVIRSSTVGQVVKFCQKNSEKSSYFVEQTHYL